MRRVGLHMENITLDDAANTFAMDQSWSDADVQRLQKIIDQVYDRFLGLVSDSRSIEMNQLQDLAGGRVWTGAQAFDRELVDHLGGLDDCLQLIARKAGLDDNYSVAHRPVVSSGFDIGALVGSGGEEDIRFDLPALASRWIQSSGMDLQQTRTILSEAMKTSGRPTIWLLGPCEFSIN